MESLFAELARQASANARREVEAYAREIAELEFLDTNSRARAETLEYALWFRRRTIELSPDNSELSDDDLGYIAAIGETRAAAGMSLDARQRVLRLHTSLMLREINEATDAQRGVGVGVGVGELMRMMHWFAPQGERGIRAYSQGFVTALRHRLPYVEQAALLARSLLKGDPISAGLASALGIELPEHCAVTVIRVPDRPVGDRDLESEIEVLVKTHHAPITWWPGKGSRSGELIALIPLRPAAPPASTGSGNAETVQPHSVPDPVSDLVRDFAQALGRPCAAGTVTSSLSEVADALDLARRVSRAAPLRRASARPRPHTMSDVFVELAVADAPFVDAWLRAVGRSLRPGPDLVVTLDAYYRHDMHRGAAAAALNVHPRTLDYRLRRVRELTGIDPGSTRGVRILSSVVTRRLSEAWH